MRLHSDTLTPEDLRDALRGTGVYLDFATLHASRSRARGIEFRLVANAGPGRRRRNSGVYGAGHEYAATWDEHGDFFATLFDLDPEAIIGPYKGRSDFHQKTKAAYRL